MPFDSQRIRPLAIAIVRRPSGEVLAVKGWDKVKQEYFYRVLGGGIEFGETAAETVGREFLEEMGASLKNLLQLDVVENIFTYNGKPGHEIVFIMEADLADASLYQKEHLPFVEPNAPAPYAEWVPLTPQTRIYPEKVKNLLGIL